MSAIDQYERKAPEQPKYTCPHIDDLKEKLKSASADLEDIRTMNSDLREHGDHWEAATRKLAERVDELEAELEERDERIKELEEDLIVLEKGLAACGGVS